MFYSILNVHKIIPDRSQLIVSYIAHALVCMFRYKLSLDHNRDKT